jgi:hypothetical protein
MLIIGFIVVSIWIYIMNSSKNKKINKYMPIPINYSIYNNIQKLTLDIVNNIDNYSIDEINDKINDIVNLYIDDYFPNKTITNIKLFKELKRKETIRLIKNSLFDKYNNDDSYYNYDNINIEIKRNIVLNKMNELNRYFKVLEEMHDIDIIINE